MSHALDFTKGSAAIAYKAANGKPWHGYGNHILDSDGPEEIAVKAGLDYTVNKSPVGYTIPNPNFVSSEPISEANPVTIRRGYDNRAVVYRDDTGEALSVMSDSYTPAQPIELLRGLNEVVKGNGYEMDVAGALKGGRVVWGLAKRLIDPGMIGDDMISPYLLLLTSYDGTYARTARLTSVRAVCQNTISLSAMVDGKTTSRQRNSGEFTVEKAHDIFAALGQFDAAFADYVNAAKEMAKVRMTDDSLKRFFAKLYAPKAFGSPDNWQKSVLDFGADGVTTNQKNNVADLVNYFVDSPGSALPSANGTLWGALNAVTFYQDHTARTKDNKRWESATIGQGNRAKDSALALAMELIG